MSEVEQPGGRRSLEQRDPVAFFTGHVLVPRVFHQAFATLFVVGLSLFGVALLAYVLREVVRELQQ